MVDLLQGNCEYEPAIKIVKKGTGKPGAHRYADGIRCLLNWIGGRQSPGIRRQVETGCVNVGISVLETEQKRLR